MALNVLLVDDSDVTRAMIAKTLRLAELPIGEVVEAANGEEALEVLDRHWVDLILADLNMPVMDGMQMVEKMAEDGLLSTIPVVIVSTEGSMPRIDRLKAKGVAAYVRKPFTPQDIRDVVEEVLEGESPADREDTLGNVFCEVLERFGMVLGEPVGREGLMQSEDGYLATWISFSGDLGGILTLAVHTQLCAELAANVLGADEHDPLVLQSAPDALKELLNVTSGHVITALAGRHAVCDLAPPIVSAMGRAEWIELLDCPDTRCFIVGDGPALLNLRLED